MKHKKIILTIAALCFLGVAWFYLDHIEENDQQWFTLENISYDESERIIEGNCTEGTYTGDMVIYLPDEVSDTNLKDGQTIKVQGGPGMTMSIPPQLMNCTKIEIVAK